MSIKKVSLETVYQQRESAWESLSDQQQRSLDECWDEGFVAGFLAAQEYFVNQQ